MNLNSWFVCSPALDVLQFRALLLCSIKQSCLPLLPSFNENVATLTSPTFAITCRRQGAHPGHQRAATNPLLLDDWFLCRRGNIVTACRRRQPSSSLPTPTRLPVKTTKPRSVTVSSKFRLLFQYWQKRCKCMQNVPGTCRQWRNWTLEPEGKLSWKGPSSQNSEKPWDMLVKSDVNGYTKP